MNIQPGTVNLSLVLQFYLAVFSAIGKRSSFFPPTQLKQASQWSLDVVLQAMQSSFLLHPALAKF
jgi:hypothetical protein